MYSCFSMSLLIIALAGYKILLNYIGKLKLIVVPSEDEAMQLINISTDKKINMPIKKA